MNTYSWTAACPRNTEDLVATELKDQNISVTGTAPGAVLFEGPLEAGYRCCLYSRVASRVTLMLKTFTDLTPEGLYRAIKELPWEEHFSSYETIAVDVTGSLPQGQNPNFWALKTKDGICDRFTETEGKRPSVDRSEPDFRIRIHMNKTEGRIGLDLSGRALHRRGYRPAGVPAPLKETVAAALLYRAGWPKIAAAGGCLVDPMCGSGTIIAEAALMALDTAPGLLNSGFSFLKWKKHDPELWNKLTDEAKQRDRRSDNPEVRLFGFDDHTKAMGLSGAALRAAGVESWCKFAICPVEKLSSSDTASVPREIPGLVVTNPPYGVRLGDKESLMPLYRTLADRTSELFGSWQLSIICPDSDLLHATGLRPRKRHTLFNGSLECTAAHYPLLSPEDRAARQQKNREEAQLKRESRPLSEGAQMFANRLKKNKKSLKSWLSSSGVTSYRLYDADMPEYSVAVDIYDGKWVTVSEYEPPKTVDMKKRKVHLNEVMDALPKSLDIPKNQIFLKTRKKQRGADQYVRENSSDNFFIAREGGHRFYVNFTDYLDTGLFLDHRLMRKRIENEAREKRFLNCFCYTATATVYAAAGQCSASVSVDTSQKYLDWGEQNLTLNGLSGNHRFVRRDVMEFLKYDMGRYDLIFIDPPTFSNNKKEGRIFDVQTDHCELIRLAMKRLSREGTLYFSNNYRRFTLDPALVGEFSITEITKETTSIDFSRKALHRSWKICHRS